MFASETNFLQQLAVLVVCHSLTVADVASQYFLVQRPMSWNQSREFCQTHYVDLAVLSTEEDYFFLCNATAAEKVNFWLGLQRSKDKSWTWVDGAALHYQQWLENNVGPCGSFEAMLKKSKKMLSRFCDEPHAFVCQGPLSPQRVSVVSGSDYVILSWNVSALMQRTRHSYTVTRCSSECKTNFYHYANGSASITIHISNLTSATDYTFEITASVARPDTETGRKITLQCSPTTLLVKTEDILHYTVTSTFVKSFKVVFLAPPLWVLYLILKKGELKESDQDVSLMVLPAEDTAVDMFSVRTRGVG